LAKAASEIEPVVSAFAEYKNVLARIEEANHILGDPGDPELAELAGLELEELRGRERELEERLRAMLVPRDARDDKNVLVEIRAGAGGDEAALFAADLARMYTKYAERHGLKLEVLEAHPTGPGGFKEIILSIQGKGAWSRLKFERGVHRVQRVPATESAGRIHTSTVTVAVLPEAEDVDVKIDDKDLKVDVYRSSGPGGQGVNTTDSAVRITYLPTGLVVTCQDERSQLKNRAKAMRVLRARLLEQAQEEQRSQIAAARKSQVGTGERSERIRTYNFPQGRVTDHRIGLTVHQLPEVLEGNLDELVAALLAAERAEQLESLEA
jgi:peptide chain release factor 1